MLFRCSQTICSVVYTRIFIRDWSQAHLVMVSKNPASHSIISKNQGTCAGPWYPAQLHAPRHTEVPECFFGHKCKWFLYPGRELAPFSCLTHVSVHSLLCFLYSESQVPVCKGPRPVRHSLPLCWVDSEPDSDQRVVFVEKSLSNSFMTLQPEPAYLSRLY